MAIVVDGVATADAVAAVDVVDGVVVVVVEC